MGKRATLATTLVLLLLFELRGHSPASAHEGTQFLPLQTQQHQGSNGTERWEEGRKGGHEDAGGGVGYAGVVDVDGGGMQLMRSAKASSGGSAGGGSSGGPGSGGKGGRSTGGGETALRQKPVRSCGGVYMARPVPYCVIVMLLASLLFLV